MSEWTSLARPEDLLRFWVEDVGPAGWYEQKDALDALIRERFEPTWRAMAEGACGLWLTWPRGALAYVVLADQFPRNMFRGQARSFASDRIARAAAKASIDRGWDLQVPEPERQFFYLPLMHSENLVDQDRCVRLFAGRMPEVGPSQMVHARVHREMIRRFGRFPLRNPALGRADTPAEAAWREAGGYGAMMKELTTAA